MKKFITSLLVVGTLSAAPVHAHSNSPHTKTIAAPTNGEQKEFGISGDPKKVSRTITVSMTDQMRFDPSGITVKLGETVKFIVKNNGKLMHEMVLGTMKELKEHAEQMKKHPEMEHDEPHMAHVQPGKTEEIVWTFNRPGEFSFACLIAGHFESGMVGKISVK